MMVRLLRHAVYMQYGVPKKYAGAKSTAPAGPQSISDGGKLYATQCAACHGRDGMGSGDPGKAGRCHIKSDLVEFADNRQC